uniref:ATP synthase F0 subunit 6 n=1 Tax=Hiatella arctica TaxID=120431 RepID=Q06SC2_9BIVA|nr:ATP synthase F0 subunit 6 [Hiatella arctica]
MMSDLFSSLDHSPAQFGSLLVLYWFFMCSGLLHYINSVDYWYIPTTNLIHCFNWVEAGEFEEVFDVEHDNRWGTVGGYASFFTSIMVLLTFIQSLSFIGVLFSPNMVPTGLLCGSTLIMSILGWASFSSWFDRPKFFGEMWFPEFGYVAGFITFQLMFFVWLTRSITLAVRLMANILIGHILMAILMKGIVFSISTIFFVLDGGMSGSLSWCTFMKFLSVPGILLKMTLVVLMRILELLTGCIQLWVFGLLINMYGNEIL